MDKPDKTNKTKKSAKPKSGKKRTSEGPSCSMFLVELSRKLAQKKKEEENTPRNIVQSIVDSITNALPIVFSKKPSQQLNQSPVNIETLQELAPELQRNDLIEIAPPVVELVNNTDEQVREIHKKTFKIPKMPVMSSEVFKQKRYVPTEDVAVNTSSNLDVAANISKYVETLKKISLIAEEFNQKTEASISVARRHAPMSEKTKNLKDIVDSVQEDLKVKLEELQMERKLMKVDQPMQVEQEDLERAGTSK